MIATFGTQASGDIPLAAPLSYRLPMGPPSTGTVGSPGTGTWFDRYRHGWFNGHGFNRHGFDGYRHGVKRHGFDRHGLGWHRLGSFIGYNIKPAPAQSPTSGHSGTGSHKVTHKKAVSHPAPKPSHAKKPAKHVQKKATPHAKSKPKVQVHVVSNPAHKVVKVSTSSTCGPEACTCGRSSLARYSRQPAPFVIEEASRLKDPALT